MPSLRTLLADLTPREPLDSAVLALEARGVADDSRRVSPGDLFVAVRGQTVDGHAFLAAAAERGALAAIVETRSADFPGPQIVVSSSSVALALVVARFYDRPADALRLVGVTGTNGKTTTTHLVEAMLLAAGRKVGLIGTVVYRSPAGSRAAPFTTPTPRELHATLAEMRDAGATDVVMEVSSHALALDRVAGLRFAVAAFTNLTQDHLDLHGTMAAYGDAKARLFAEHLAKEGTAVVCVDGDGAARMLAAARGRVLRVSARGQEADVRVLSAPLDAGGMALRLTTPLGELAFVSPLVGGFNQENLAMAAAIGVALGLDVATITRGLSSAHGAPGRLERVAGEGPATFVDYAHTPDALQRALEALRPLATERSGALWVVFGCGGDRDRGKRPQMARIAERGADRVVVTSDNPRTEEPAAIVEQIVAGFDLPERVMVAEDRRAAILRAVTDAMSADVILVAGKGHEDYQIIGHEKRHFDDREEVRAALARRR